MEESQARPPHGRAPEEAVIPTKARLPQISRQRPTAVHPCYPAHLARLEECREADNRDQIPLSPAPVREPIRLSPRVQLEA